MASRTPRASRGTGAGGRANPGGSIAEIDGGQVSDPNGYVPAEAIIGIFVIGSDGRATGEYVRNPHHGPVRDDLTKLESPDVWLGWLADTPAAAVREEIAKTLAGQVSGSTLEWLKVIDEPVHLAGGGGARRTIRTR